MNRLLVMTGKRTVRKHVFGVLVTEAYSAYVRPSHTHKDNYFYMYLLIHQCSYTNSQTHAYLSYVCFSLHLTTAKQSLISPLYSPDPHGAGYFPKYWVYHSKGPCPH